MSEDIKEYIPSPILRRFHESESFVRGIRGPIGSGKSTACAMEIVRRAARQEPGPDGVRRTRWAAVRNTYRELEDTTMKTWNDWCRDLGVWHKQSNTFVLKDGDIECEVIFRALDKPNDISKLLSLELTGAWINEARELPRAIVDNIQGRLDRYPSMSDGGPTWSGLIMDTNPPDSDHWWYRLFEEDHPEGWEQFVQPSGLAEDAENLQHHKRGRGYYERLLPGKDPEWIKVYVHGEYGMVMDGKPIHPNYRDNLHCAEVEPMRGPVIVGMDFGLTPAAVFCQRDAMGNWTILDELVTENMGAKRFGELIVGHLNTQFQGHTYRAWGDPAGEQRAQTDERTVFQILRTAGLKCGRAPTNDFLKRVESVNQALSRLFDGHPGVRVHPRCKRLRKALSGGYCYRRLQVSGDERFRDVPDKNMHSHVAEALQYAFIGEGEGANLLKQDGKGFRPATNVVDFDLYA